MLYYSPSTKELYGYGGRGYMPSDAIPADIGAAPDEGGVPLNQTRSYKAFAAAHPAGGAPVTKKLFGNDQDPRENTSYNATPNVPGQLTREQQIAQGNKYNIYTGQPLMGADDYLVKSLQSGNIKQTGNNWTEISTGKVFTNDQIAQAMATPIASAIKNSGYTVDPKQFALVDFREFLGEAGNIIDPYYKSQFDQIKNTVSTKLGQYSEDLTKKQEELNRTSAETTRADRNTLAERGLSFSGQRQNYDTTATENLNRSLDLANTTTYRAGQDLLTKAESQIGTSNLQGLNYNLGGRSLSFNPTPVTGELQYGQTSSRDTLARLLASDKNAANQYAYNLKNTSF